MEFVEVPKLVQGVLAQILGVSVRRQVRVHTHTQVDDRWLVMEMMKGLEGVSAPS